LKTKYQMNIADIEFESVNHGTAKKKVFFKTAGASEGLTQFAYSVFLPGEACQEHVHPTMDEFFFVIRGSGTYYIGAEQIILRSGDFITIPSGVSHRVIGDADEALELVYFGIAK
jgi:quercetin dioxygenase-like cupin family protein